MIKNKKAFTLVELLAAVSILGIIMIIALPQISKLVQENNKNKYKKYGEAVVTASKLYTDSYTKDMFGNNDYGCKNINLNELMNKGLIEDIKIDNATCNTANTFIEISKNKDNYKYKLSIYCVDTASSKILHNDAFAPNLCPGGDDEVGPTLSIEIPGSLAGGWVSGTAEKIKVKLTDGSGLKENAEIEYVWSNSDAEPTTEGTKYNFENKRGEPESIIEIPLPPNATGEYYLHVRPTNAYDSRGNPAATDWIKSEKIQIDTVSPTQPQIVLYKKIEKETEECIEKFLGFLWCSEYKKEITEEKVTPSQQMISDSFPLYTRAYGSVDNESGLQKYSYKFTETAAQTDIAIENCPTALGLGSGMKCSQEVALNTINDNLIYYNATDNAGNQSTSAALSLQIKGDTTAPECNTSGGSISWTNQNVTIKGNCSDPDCADYGLFGLSCKEPTEASGCVENQITKTFTTNTDDKISPGKVCDNEGNCTTCDKETVKIDKDSPNAPSYDVKTDSSTGEKTIYISATDNGPSGIDYYQCSMTGAKRNSNFKEYPGLITKASVTVDVAGTTTLSCYSVDEAGNSSTSSSTTVTVTIVEKPSPSPSPSPSSTPKPSPSSTPKPSPTPTPPPTPAAPTIKIYKWTDNSTRPSSISGLTEIPSGSTSTVSVRTIASSSGAAYYEYTTTGKTKNETSQGSYRDIEAEGASTIKYRACNSSGSCSAYTTATITLVKCKSTTTSWNAWSTCDCKTAKKTRTGTKLSTINNSNCGSTSETKDCTSECQGICSKASSTVFGGNQRNATPGNAGPYTTVTWKMNWCQANNTTCKPNPNAGYPRICVIPECKGMTAEELNDKYGCSFARMWCSCK